MTKVIISIASIAVIQLPTPSRRNNLHPLTNHITAYYSQKSKNFDIFLILETFFVETVDIRKLLISYTLATYSS